MKNIQYKMSKVNNMEGNDIPQLVEENLHVSNNTNKDNENMNELTSSSTESKKRRRRRPKEKLYFSFRHTVYLICLWIIFAATFAIGFIVHFDTVKNVTASSIMWTFSIVIFIISVLYSYNYYKCSKAKSEEELQKRLKYFPC